jgi:hypothetical protein
VLNQQEIWLMQLSLLVYSQLKININLNLKT